MNFENFLKDILSKYKKEEITFLGMGNPYRSDDGFGIEFVKKVKSLFQNSFTEFDNKDEVVLELCNNNDKGILIFVDVSDFEGKSGDLKILSYDEIEDIDKHFHKIPIKLYMKLLISSQKESYILAIKPKNLKSVNEPKLSEIVAVKLDEIVTRLKEFTTNER
ncbi:MAG TPA: hydrogenase maturation protease [Candidatus Cloacimonetes bacterium]|nr:hydrogenase maturation protease [Candidatus Cloacimonadota bacterium]